ncbi:MAG TPA: VWA domain-containing protein [Candidatus Angelobacter sp.]
MAQPTTGCFAQRPPVDVVLVLDKSGSMASTRTLGGPSRMDALHTAVSNFVGVWSSLPPTSGDQIAAVVFDTTSPTNPPMPMFPLSLTDMTMSANQTTVISAVGGVTPGGWTSIGAGLNQANQLFASDGHRKVILLMSDGQQNTEPLVKGDGGLYCNNAMVCTAQNPPIPQTCTAMNSCPLSNHPQIYTVTVGPSGQVDPSIAQAIATGFYLNTETNYPLLSPFFLELLQNFLKFNTYETVRIISEPTPYSAMVPISTTSYNAVFSLMWPSQALLRLTVTPPGGGKPIVQESGSGFISIVQTLPLPAPFDPMGDWKINVEAVNPNVTSTGVTTTQGGVPFDLHIMTDDAGIKTDLAVVPGDYKPGDKIRLRAKLTRFGLPILGLGSHRGDKIEAELIRPGKSIGDILSESTENADSSGSDPQSSAQAKLDNTLRKDPSKLKREKVLSVTLYDDGKLEHGDDVAGDGIYSALYPATLPGHYNFTLAAESVAPDSVRFSRQQLRTVYVRPYPDPGNTDFKSSINFGGRGADNKLSIVMTPRTKAGDHVGPGWTNYFWFTAPGVPPFKAKDNLDGTYTATLAFTGAKPPKVSVAFEDALAVIGDSVTFDNLPAKPTVLVDHIPEPPGKLAIFLDLGGSIPHGTFSNAFDRGFSLNGGLEYIVNPHFSAEGIFGYHHFPAKIGGDVNLYQFSINGKTYLTTGKIQPFVNGGIGGYNFSPGTTNFGGNIGGGVLCNLTSRLGLQGSYNFHGVNTPVAATKFSTFQGGVRLVF